MNAVVSIRRAAAVLGLGAISGCAVGPDFARPGAPDAVSYPAEPPGSVAPRLATGRDVPADWWTVFGSAELDGLIDQSLRNNPNVQAAQAALRAAQEDVSAQKGSFWPSVSGDLNSSRQETASQLSPTLNSGVNPFSLHTAEVSVSYSLDVFGGNRRQVESLAAQAESQRFQLEATRISLAANIVSGVVQAASLRDQIAATQEIGQDSER